MRNYRRVIERTGLNGILKGRKVGKSESFTSSTPTTSTTSLTTSTTVLTTTTTAKTDVEKKKKKKKPRKIKGRKEKRKDKKKPFSIIMDEIRCRLIKFNFEVENDEFPVPNKNGKSDEDNGVDETVESLFPKVCIQIAAFA